MNKKEVGVISVIIEAESEKMKKVNLDAIAERINRLIQGEKVEALTNTENEYKSCDGIDIGGFVCVGSSKY
ncbi:hypothetical protein ACU5CE_27420 [Priestia megaterium]|uniref:hypothetical protein n=1 Tax=Priestia megaterium TaxID=1404 RepID=UPI00406BDAF2